MPDVHPFCQMRCCARLVANLQTDACLGCGARLCPRCVRWEDATGAVWCVGCWRPRQVLSVMLSTEENADDNA